MTANNRRIPTMLLDTDFFAKPKVLRLTQEFGAAGPCAILLICAKLMNADDGVLPRSDIEALGFQLGIDRDTWRSIVALLIEMDWLVMSDDIPNYFYSPRANDDRAKVLAVRDAWTKNGKKGGRPKITQNNPIITHLYPNHNPTVTQSTDTDTDTEDLDLDLETNGLSTPEVRRALRDWIDYRAERKPKVTKTSLKALTRRYAKRPSDLCRDIDWSIGQGWQGVYTAKDGNAAVGTGRGQQSTGRPIPKAFVPVWEKDKK